MKALKMIAVVALLSSAIAILVREHQMERALLQCRSGLNTCQLEITQLKAELAASRVSAATSKTDNLLANTVAQVSAERTAINVPKQQDDLIGYGSNTKLQVGNGMTVSSPTGLMVSDNEKKIIGGDLLIETPDANFETTDGMVDVAKQIITGKRISMEKNQSPGANIEITDGVIDVAKKKMTGKGMRIKANQAPVPTATSVTPAADAPVAPAATAAHL